MPWLFAQSLSESLLPVVVPCQQALINREEGGVVAQNLDSMYDFIIQSVTLANLNSDIQPLDGALNVLEELRTGWKELEQMTQDGEVVGTSGPLKIVR